RLPSEFTTLLQGNNARGDGLALSTKRRFIESVSQSFTGVHRIQICGTNLKCLLTTRSAHLEQLSELRSHRCHCFAAALSGTQAAVQRVIASSMIRVPVSPFSIASTARLLLL